MGLLIQTSFGSGGDAGAPRTKRSGWRCSGIESQLTVFAHCDGQTVVDHAGSSCRCRSDGVHRCNQGKKVWQKPGHPGDSRNGRETRAVFHGTELAFRVKVVVRGVRSAVGFGHAEICQQQSHRFGSHGEPGRVDAEGVGWIFCFSQVSS